MGISVGVGVGLGVTVGVGVAHNGSYHGQANTGAVDNDNKITAIPTAVITL